jgi:ATPase subunit of ABC transporter with duplicated ATPase domains
VKLALELPAIVLPEENGDTLVLRDVSALVNGQELFASLDLCFGRRRVAIVGPNGSGKTTLLNVMIGERRASSGTVFRDMSKIGVIGQGGGDWKLDEPLIERLRMEAPAGSLEDAARLVVAHRFPLALAERPMRTLSPGERARAALLCLFHRRPVIELLVLDEPTHGLDLIGQRALVDALRAWSGGLVVTSHDAEFLGAVGFDETIELGMRR